MCRGPARLRVATNGGSFGVSDSVILDAAGPSGRIVAFTGNDGTAGASAAVVQLTQSLTGEVRTHIGRGSVGATIANWQIHSGAFDNNYFGASPSTGQLYVCGTGTNNTQPFHYWIGFDSYPLMDATPTGSIVRTAVSNLPCAPYTEIFNPNLDLGGVAGHQDLLISGLMGGGGNGFIITNDISSGSIASSLNFVTYPGGISGTVIDNVSTSGQASSIYFTTQGAVTVGTCSASRCAVKLTQADLQ